MSTQATDITTRSAGTAALALLIQVTGRVAGIVSSARIPPRNLTLSHLNHGPSENEQDALIARMEKSRRYRFIIICAFAGFVVAFLNVALGQAAEVSQLAEPYCSTKRRLRCNAIACMPRRPSLASASGL